MTIVPGSEIIKLFNALNDSKIRYVLLRNINGELPNQLTKGKDVDFLVHPSDKSKFRFFVETLGFKKIRHPFHLYKFLYNLESFHFFEKKDLILDICYQIACQSLNKNEKAWLPLDCVIQESFFANRVLYEENDFKYWKPCFEDELIGLIVRSVFDKRIFLDSYIETIEILFDKIKINNVSKKLNLIFFKFTPKLLDMLKLRSYDKILDQYLTFKDY